MGLQEKLFLGPIYGYRFVLTLSRSSTKVKGQSSRSQEENVAKVVGATSNEGVLVRTNSRPTLYKQQHCIYTTLLANNLQDEFANLSASATNGHVL